MIHGEKHKLKRSEREEVIPRYIFASLIYYWEEYEDEKLEERDRNFEPQIHYLVEQKATT
jgi:hypothetical protein